MADGPVEAGKIVAGNGCPHVMLGVKIHVPVKKLEKWIDEDRAAAEPIVGDLVDEADVLGVVQQIQKPATIITATRDDNGQNPEASPDRDQENGGMSG